LSSLHLASLETRMWRAVALAMGKFSNQIDKGWSLPDSVADFSAKFRSLV